MLSVSVGGEEMTSVDILTIRCGQVSPTEFLKKIRVDIINLVYELFKSTNDTKTKLRLVQVLDKVTQPPHNVEVSPDLIQMMRQDSDYLVDIYREIVSEGNPAVIGHIEHTLLWMNRSERFRTEKSEELRKEILGDEFYKIFKLLVGDRADYQEEDGWKEAERKHREQMTGLISSISEPNLGDWSVRLNRIAEQRDFVEAWQFSNFEHFLIEFAQIKPQLADILFEDALTRKLPLRFFIVGFLIGIRMENEFELWDKYAEKIIRSQDIEYIRPLVYSLCLPIETNLTTAIRDKDIDIIETIVNQNGPFSYLKGVTNPLLHYALVETILRNHKRTALRMESLFMLQIDNDPKYLETSLREIPIAIARSWINITELQPETVKFLADKLTIIPDLNWEMQELLLDIGQVAGSSEVLKVFLKRIHIDEESRKEKKVPYKRYEAIPYQWDPRLQEFISKDRDYLRTMSEWIENMTPRWSIYNANVGDFLQRIGTGFTEILMSLIQKGDDISLKKAALIMHSIEGSHFDLSIEIVRRTNNKDIQSTVAANMYATGAVWGEYGIATAFENKAKELEKYKDDPSELVRQFVVRMIQSLEKDAIRERQRADEEKQLRRIEFEG